MLQITRTPDRIYDAHDRVTTIVDTQIKLRITYHSEQKGVGQQCWKTECEQGEEERAQNELIYFIMPRIGSPMQDVEPFSCQPCKLMTKYIVSFPPLNRFHNDRRAYVW
jgi:hypothetical protein